MNIGPYRFVQTCTACPEQYDVYYDGEQVAYVRLRHGQLYASIPRCGDKIVYVVDFLGDPWKGCFDGEDERAFHLYEITQVVERERKNMTEQQEVTLESLKAAVLADGVIDAEEVTQIRTAIYADGKIDREEADFIFDLNDVVSGRANDPSWTQLFVDSISSYVLEDDTSPGVIDSDEAAYLKEKIHGDGQVDETEKALLSNLKTNAQGDIPADVQFLFDMYLSSN